MSIGEVAERSGTPITTLRYYESIGLVPPPARRGGQRRYDESVLQRLMVIRFCKIAGLSVADIARVLSDDSPERAVMHQIARDQIALIDQQMAQVGLARRMLAATMDCRCPDLLACSCGALEPVVREIRANAALATAHDPWRET
jgi:DNA-binding transcriptional MerR regulator